MSDTESEIKALRMQVTELQKEVTELREFIKSMYLMLSEGEEYEGNPAFLGGAEYGRPNT